MKLVPASLVVKFSRQFLVMKKNSPHIFFGIGVVGTVAGTVLACRATLKLSETLDEIKKDVESIKPVVEPSDSNIHLVLDDPAIHHMDTMYVYGKASLRLVRLYAPSVVIGGISIGLLTGSHIQLAKRNTALMAAYAAVQKAFDEYRERIRDEVGEVGELEIYHGTRTEIVTDADGNTKEVKIADPNHYSAYAKFFDEYSDNWKRDPELNRIFIQCQQNYFNNRLQAYGHVFLNEVYDALGVQRTKAGAVVGWLLTGDGDGYVDFGLFEAYNSLFVNGSEPSIILDFNVDGVIYDKI